MDGLNAFLRDNHNLHCTKMQNNEALDSYFRELKCIIDDHKLLDKPENIYNVGETGMPLGHQAPHIVG